MTKKKVFILSELMDQFWLNKKRKGKEAAHRMGGGGGRNKS